MKQRLDLRLVELELVDSRSRAQALIRAGRVLVDGQVSDKPGAPVDTESRVEVRVPDPYVGRGAHKLIGALERFRIDVAERNCLDVGASTGGFTQVLLERGASRVYSVDVGRGQLAWRLRNEVRVVAMERTDIRSVERLPDAIDLATVDVSFISLRLVLPSVRPLLAPDATVLCLVKPQFEAGREAVGKGGVVREPHVHREVLQALIAWAGAHGWEVRDAAPSPLLGASGNREFWLRLAVSLTGVEDPAPVGPLIDAALG